MAARRDSIFFPNLFGLAILFLSVLSPHFWFVLPAAISLLVHSRFLVLRILPFVGFVLSFYSYFWIQSGLSALDTLSFLLLFLEGFCLRWLLRPKVSMSWVILSPLLVALLSGVILFKASGSSSFEAWVSTQIQSDIFPYFFRAEDWPEAVSEIYRSILLPILRAGLLGWFASMMAMSFFVNAVLESLIRGRFRRAKIWDDFNKWRASEWILVPLVLGLLSLVIHQISHQPALSLLAIMGWHLTVLSLFLVFIQGVAVVSYFIPKVSPLFFIIIFVLLVLQPIAVLILAGLTDLWFDFRSKIRSDPSAPSRFD